MVGLALSIKGGMDSMKEKGAPPNTLMKVSIIIFTLIYAAAVGIFVLLLQEKRGIPSGETRLLASFAACIPFIVVRLIYSLIGDFSNNPDFSRIGGNDTIWLCMSVIEEIIVVLIVVAVGLTLKKLAPEPSVKASVAGQAYGQPDGYEYNPLMEGQAKPFLQVQAYQQGQTGYGYAPHQ